MESVKLKTKGSVHKHCPLLDKVVSMEYRLMILKPLYMCTGVELLSKLMADDGS